MKTYDGICSNVKFDDAFFSRLLNFKTGWERKGEHLLFLASGTIGEQKLTFSIVDEEMLFTEVYKLDTYVVKDAYSNISAINNDYKTVSNHKFMLLIYTIVRIHQLKIPEEKKNQYIYYVYSIFFFMKMSSLISGSPRFAQRPADPEVAQAVYELLPLRYIVKQKGNWQRTTIYVATDFYSRKYREKYENGINYERVLKPTDSNLLATVMNMSTKLSGYINNIYGVYMEVIEKGIKGATTSIIDDFGDEGSSIKDIVNNSKYVSYMKDILSTPTDFIRPKVVQYVCDITGADEVYTTTTLRYMSDNHLANFKEIEELLSIPIIEGIAYLDSRDYMGKDLTSVIDEAVDDLAGKWRVGKGQTEQITKFKISMQEYVKTATKKVTTNVLTSVSITVALYIFLRAIGGNKL